MRAFPRIIPLSAVGVLFSVAYIHTYCGDSRRHLATCWSICQRCYWMLAADILLSMLIVYTFPNANAIAIAISSHSLSLSSHHSFCQPCAKGITLPSFLLFFNFFQFFSVVFPGMKLCAYLYSTSFDWQFIIEERKYFDHFLQINFWKINFMLFRSWKLLLNPLLLYGFFFLFSIFLFCLFLSWKFEIFSIYIKVAWWVCCIPFEIRKHTCRRTHMLLPNTVKFITICIHLRTDIAIS